MSTTVVVDEFADPFVADAVFNGLRIKRATGQHLDCNFFVALGFIGLVGFFPIHLLIQCFKSSSAFYIFIQLEMGRTPAVRGGSAIAAGSTLGVIYIM